MICGEPEIGTVVGTSKPLPTLEVLTRFCKTPAASKTPRELNWDPGTL